MEGSKNFPSQENNISDSKFNNKLEPRDPSNEDELSKGYKMDRLKKDQLKQGLVKEKILKEKQDMEVKENQPIKKQNHQVKEEKKIVGEETHADFEKIHQILKCKAFQAVRKAIPQ